MRHFRKIFGKGAKLVLFNTNLHVVKEKRKEAVTEPRKREFLAGPPNAYK